MSSHLWAEVDALNDEVLKVFEDGQPRTAEQVAVGQPTHLVQFAIDQLSALGYLQARKYAVPRWTITPAGQAHLAGATQKVTV